MFKLTRREFLERVALTSGAILAGLVFEDNEAHADVSLEVGADGTVFLEGTVDKIEDNALAIRNGPLVHVLQVSDETYLWKGEVTSISSVDLGDHIYARGIPEKEGTFAATKVWANIANLYGIVSEVRQDGFTLCHGYSGAESYLTVRIGPATVLNETAKADVAVFARNQLVQALGVRQRDGSLLATRLWIDGEAESQPAE